MSYVLLIVGFLLLVKGADWFVEGSSSLAKRLRVPSVVIGLTIVAMGTSAPEAAVSITAGLKGNNAIAFGNIVGSNLFNLLAIVGICALLKPSRAELPIVKRDFPVSIAATVLLILFVAGDFCIGRIEGLILLVCMILYVVYLIYQARKNPLAVEQDEIKTLALWKCLLFLVLGLGMIIFGGTLVVDNASVIAKSLGLSDNLIGLTIVAIGTSLPELVTSVTAARKGDSGLALGNVVGSNIFNILFILGFSSILTPVAITGESMIDVILLLCVTVAFYLPLLKKNYTGRVYGALGVLAYVLYTVYIILR